MVGLIHTFLVQQIYCDFFFQGYLLNERTLESSFTEQSFRSERASNFIKMKDCKYFSLSVLVILQLMFPASHNTGRHLNNQVQQDCLFGFLLAQYGDIQNAILRNRLFADLEGNYVWILLIPYEIQLQFFMVVFWCEGFCL